MNITIAPEIEQAIREQAERSGTTPEQFVIDTLWQRIVASRQVGGQPTSDSWEQLLDRVGSATGVSLSDEALSRENWYN